MQYRLPEIAGSHGLLVGLQVSQGEESGLSLNRPIIRMSPIQPGAVLGIFLFFLLIRIFSILSNNVLATILPKSVTPYVTFTVGGTVK